MPEKIFLHFLILCGIWSQGIFGTFADEENKDLSNFLDRQKRVVSHVPGEDIAVNINEVPYVVYIKEDMRISCVGSILSLYVVITSASCAAMDPKHYQVITSSSRTGNGNTHYVMEIRKRIGDLRPHLTNWDGVGLLIVNSPFVYSHYCQPIRLHTGTLQPGTVGKIHGWGYNFRSENRGTNIPRKLRSIEVPIISHQNCVNRYRPDLEISDKNVCTYHPQRHSGHIDFGAGLVVDGYLAGVFLWSGLIGQTDPRYPDVFAFLQNSQYNQWIRTNVQSIDTHFQNLRQH